jgi:hypothetical protein
MNARALWIRTATHCRLRWASVNFFIVSLVVSRFGAGIQVIMIQ